MSNNFQFNENSVINDESNYMKVSHIKLRGSNFDIGKKLAEIAHTRHNVNKVPWTDSEKVRAQVQFMKKNYPIHFERMKGAASYFGMDLEQSDIDFSMLLYYMGVPGCTVSYYPPHLTESGSGIMSRNFDFTTGTVMGTDTSEENPGAISSPYIVEMYPDEGYASLYLSSFDLLGGVIDGINEKGLTVTMMADDETPCHHPTEPVLGSAVGIYELLLMRMLLDTCKNVEEAKACLFEMKQFYFFAPLHYLIADEEGNSFVWERSATNNKEFVIPGNNQPQIATNFLLHRYSSIDDLPLDDHRGGNMYERYRIIKQAIENEDKPLSISRIKDINKLVYWKDGYRQKYEAVPRTLWHSNYHINERRLEISFYLKDEMKDDTKDVIYSKFINFKLENQEEV